MLAIIAMVVCEKVTDRQSLAMLNVSIINEGCLPRLERCVTVSKKPGAQS